MRTRKRDLQMWAAIRRGDPNAPSAEVVANWEATLTELFENEENFRRFSQNMRLLMALRNLSIAGLSRESEYDPTHISKILKGKEGGKHPTLLCMYSIAGALGVTLHTLLNANLAQALEAEFAKKHG